MLALVNVPHNAVFHRTLFFMNRSPLIERVPLVCSFILFLFVVVFAFYTNFCIFRGCFYGQAVLSRAELLLSSGSSGQAALGVVITAMGAAVDAWSRLEAEDAEKRRKEAEILKYKMQEHVVSQILLIDFFYVDITK